MALFRLCNKSVNLNLMFFDLCFYYFITLKQLWYLKFKFLNKMQFLPLLKSLWLVFSVQRLEQLDHPRIFNYVYLFAFFFGRRALVSGYRPAFALGRHYYSFDLGIFFSKKQSLYMPLAFLIYELQPALNLKITTAFNFPSPSLFRWNL